ncbi:MAG: TIGR03960 family B12-binding radical SAM protein [Thermoleophilia bacterium]
MPKESHGEDRLRHDLTDLLARVARPGRYVGGEFHARHKPGASPRIVLSYPDVYEIGIANTGLQILYAGINDATAAVAERAYCPWPDMAALMRARGVPLWSLESGEPVRAAALWGFTLQHELTYTNILEMLDLAGVPLHAAARGEADPIVLGGGPGTANPLPLAPFFDAFFVGEAEGRLAAIAAALDAPTRGQRLGRLAVVPGVFLPHGPAGGAAAGERGAMGAREGRVRRQVFMGFSHTPPVTEPLVPLIEGVHDRAVIEVMRGCVAGCRFCQAGTWYRPVRERPAAMVVDAAERALRSTGCDEVSLISLSSCDYGGVREAIAGIRERFPHVRVSLPSLRVDSAAVVLARLGDQQRGSVTLAPEAGTQRLRDAINKRVDEQAFAAAVRGVFRAGYSGLKLYFMIGLPGETDDDVAAIAAMASSALSNARESAPARARVSIAVSSFVPKAHTAFERVGFAGESVIRRRQELLRERLPRQVRVRFHDVGTSLVEATMAMGGREVGELIEAAWRGGARFDGWGESFDVGIWRRAAVEVGVELGGPAWGVADDLPWLAVDPLVGEAFLREEAARAARAEITADCRDGSCASCGVCGGEIELELTR